MEPKLTITKIPHLNIAVVKQKGIHFFIAAPDSFIIDREGFLELIKGMISVDFIDEIDVRTAIYCSCSEGPYIPIGGLKCERCSKYVYGEDL